MVRKSLNTHGTLLVYLLCRLLTVGCFQKNRFGEIVNSGSQNNSKVQSTLNEDLLNPNFYNLKDLILINSMTNVITKTTRQQAILDPIIIPEDLPFLDSGTIEVQNHISDHKATYIKLPFQYDIEGAYNRLIWLHRKAYFTLLKQKISNYD